MTRGNNEIADIRKIIHEIGGNILQNSGNLRINSISRISSGEAHHNYLINLNGKKFILRESAVRIRKFRSSHRKAGQFSAGTAT